MKNYRKGKIGSIFAGIAIFLVIILVAGLCMQVFATNEKFKPSNWFTKSEQTEELPEEEDGGVTDGEGNELETDGKEQAMPTAMVFRSVSSLASTNEAEPLSVTLTATIEPADADNQNVTWKVQFKDASSAWATGKTVTSYMTVTPSAAGSLTATVKCLKAFGEQIEVVVASVENPDYTASCTCDYLKQLTAVSVEQTAEKIIVGGGVGEITASPIWSDGTITPEFVMTSSALKRDVGIQLRFSEEFQTEVNKNITSFSGFNSLTEYIPYLGYGGSDSLPSLSSGEFLPKLMLGLMASAPESYVAEATRAFKLALVNVPTNQAHAKVTAVCKYNGKLVGNAVTGEADITLDGSALVIEVTGITLNPSTWVVGA